jgi:hypothetical protein
MSQIFIDLSIEPEASTPKLEWFRDNDVTASVWLPALYFLGLLVNFLGFLLEDCIYPPSMTSG